MHQIAPLALAAFLFAPASLAQDDARLLRFPTIAGDRIAFAHGGDIWTASAQGGPARRVTSFNEGYEIYPKLSPDGKWIAFSGEYTGTRQVFLVPFEGGVPKQLTFYPDSTPAAPRHGFDHLVMDWSPDGKKLLVRACRTPYGGTIGRYFLVDPFGGGLEEPLQIPEGGPATFSPDGGSLAFNIISREWRTWKRYKAGRQQDVFTYDLATNHTEQLTDYPGTDNHPLWIGDRIYFTSDRGGTLNLWCHELKTKEQRQVTKFTDFDVLFPSRDPKAVIFECGGFLYVMDVASEKPRKLTIQLADDKPWTRPVWKEGKNAVASFDVSPSAKRAVLEFRGEIFTAPAKKGEARNLTRTLSRRERDPRWSPDGTTLSYLAEVGDDYELFLRTFDGTSGEGGKEEAATHGTGAWILDHAWAPDSKRVAFTDKKNRVSVLDVATKQVTELDRSAFGEIHDLTWSADSAWIAYAKSGPNHFDAVWLCPAAKAAPMRVTSEHYDSGSPAIDPEGRYLYCVSARDFELENLRFRERLYAVPLRKDVPSPLAPESDEEAAEKKKAAADSKPAESKPGDSKPAESKPAEEKKPFTVDADGIEARLVALPGAPGSYGGLTAMKDGFLFVHNGNLERFDLEKREAKTVLEGVGSYSLTPDGKKLLYLYQGGLCLADATPGQKAGDDKLPLDNVRVRVDPQTEWAQMYQDAWRIMRDWFYDPNMHGVDWKAMREKYAPLVAHLSHRNDLDFVLGELIGELSCGHTYVDFGENPRVARVPVGLLGCELRRDGDRYRIAKIYPGENWSEATRSPLTEPGVDARVGDCLIAIDGEELTAKDNPYRLLENKVGRAVTLVLNDKPTRDGAREVVVKPIASEQELRYRDWVHRNAEMVDKLSNGRIGYVHAPNTAEEGHRRLVEDFRPQARVKEAMILDDRYNGGGFVPERMIQALAQPAWNYWARRDSGVTPTPEFSFDGPMAMLINGYSSSGGDAFPFYFRRLHLGPLIGKRTWGGLVGYSFSPRLVDGGGLAVPSFAFLNTAGQWDVEAVGVAPDIEVFDDPALIQAGKDPTLEKAVEVLLAALAKRDPVKAPETPKGPIRK